MSRFFWIGAALVVSTAACARSAETRLKSADEAAEDAQYEKMKADDARNEAREAENDAKKEMTLAKLVQKERSRCREKLEEEIAEANAKLAPPADKPQPSQQDITRLTEKRNVLNQHLSTIGRGGDKDWPAQKERIEADLERFDDR